ncbi:ribonuclease HII [Natronobiforma cellulositropha]|uniref:ribonuclease HII n=1 Tax=Natronobiforma cellulositropha TaxID=1679076 RepID=UPI0021D5A9C6|nr:ribonuclease HII [Natronobiforma cellulositropha]
MKRFGVDEAGRGPVFGSMFAAAVFVEDRSRLPDGVGDSKRLSPARREDLAARLRETAGVSVGLAEVTPATIDDPETDMNTLTVEAHASAIGDALESVAEAGVSGLCDACDTDAGRFARRVEAACEPPVSVTARHGADDESPLVGAASIVAKVERDAHVAAIAERYGEVGSGYPSDPTTRAFLESYVADHRELPPFARASWSTCADALARVEQTGLGEF